MIYNHIKIAFRNLWRHRVFSGINLLGLAVGMSAFLLIYSYVSFERSYDTYHEKADRVYRVITDIKTATETIHSGTTSAPMGPRLKADFSQVEAETRISFDKFLIGNGEKRFQENNVLYADSSIFSVFTFPLVEGNPATALKAPFSVVLSEAAAIKYFGSADPMGQTLSLDSKYATTVTGVMKNIPRNSHFRTDIFLSMSTLTQRFDPQTDDTWDSFEWFTYVLLAKGTDPKSLQAQLPQFMERHAGDVMKGDQMHYDLSLQSLNEIYLGPQLDNYGNGAPTGSLANTYIFSIVAAFILLIASINFINLTTARASERAREVGIRKVVGAARWQLTLQFLGESILLCLIAFVLAAALCKALLPIFNQLLHQNISLEFFGYNYVWILFGIALGMGAIAGIYPALILSGFKPIAVFKSRFVSGKNELTLRQVLVVFQFTISIVLIIGTIVVYTQLKYMQDQDLGFNKNQMLIVNFYGDSLVQSQSEHIRQELASVPGVKSASFSSSIPGSDPGKWYARIENPSGEMQGANLNSYVVDFDFLQQYDIHLVSGRGFSRDFPADSVKALVINEAAARSFGYASPAEAVGKPFLQFGVRGTIIGIAKDFHYRSLQEQIQPLEFRIMSPSRYNVISVNIAGGHIKETMRSLERKWETLVPQRPFEYSFADENFNGLYSSEDQFKRVFLYFALLAIFISCLGLLGLAAYSTIQRTKEVGIRKVLGASVTAIVGLLSRDFLRLVGVALVIACPVAWYIMHRWLQAFAYRTSVHWWVFALSGCAAILIAFLTVGFHSIKAAVANPVKSLRIE